MKKCYCCGADVPDQSKFCPKCGKPMAVTRDLIDRAKANDPDAQAELYERTYKTVYSRIRAKVPDSDIVMDIMQESYLRAFTSLDQLQKAETFPSWILTIANRQVCDWYKKNGKEQQNVQMSQLDYENDDTISDEDDLLEMPEYREDFSPDESLDQAETGRLLSEILDTLPEDQRIILTMRYYDEMSLQEISDELGVNLSTIKSRLTAGKKKVEAKVLELEKSGTKLYSLGPVAFLVFLLHHAELFAPAAISANTVIGLTAAGMGTAAGGAAVSAAGVTGKAAAGVAVKAAGGAIAKGLGVKIAAVAAAVVVAGGVTAGVVSLNNNVVEKEKTIKSILWFSPEGLLKSAEQYDEKGNLLTQVEYSGATETRKYEYVYDDDGLLQTEKFYEYEDLAYYVEHDNTDGMPISSTTYNSDNGIEWFTLYSCDSDGNILTALQYGDSAIYSGFEYEYDDAGNILTGTSYYINGNISRQDEYTYDDEGNTITRKTYEHFLTGGTSSYTWEYDYTFDKTGKILTVTIYQDGEELYVGIYEYYD